MNSNKQIIHVGSHVAVEPPDEPGFLGTVMPPPVGEKKRAGWIHVQPDEYGKELAEWPTEWISVVI